MDNVVRIIITWSEWRDLNSRPLDPQSSALPAAPHPVIPEFSLLSAYRLFANRRGASFRNIVAVLRLERSFRSLFLHLGAMPSSATGGGISPRPAAPHPESSSIIPQEKRFDKSFSKLFFKTRQLFYFSALSLYFSASSMLKSKGRKESQIWQK